MILRWARSPWLPREIEIRGCAEAIEEPDTIIRIYPERIVSWGLGGQRSACSIRR